MSIKKEIRSDNTYIISTDNTDNPKLGAKILSDGKESLFLDYYFGYNILFSIPVIGIILLFVFALGGTNKVNLRKSIA